MLNGNDDGLRAEANRSPRAGVYGEGPRDEVWHRIRLNVLGLSLLLAVMTGLGSAVLLFVGGSVLVGVVGPLLMAGASAGAIRGYRRREWTWALGSLAGTIAWFAALAAVMN
ncbi:hypothetical protein AB0D86_13370 [Streptomyces sp. NPDC048324]|uniref:hypothetical protein n=1 Tax=Streptomyces sp. NPDC048324 TaxID=3157205 RepID=UPI003447F46C